MLKLRSLTTVLFSGALALGTLNLTILSPIATAQALEFKKGALMIEQPFARANIPQRPGAAYARIMNMGGEDDRLIGASSPAAGRVELHTHLMENGVARMRPIESVDVPAGGAAELKPGGHHIMMFDLAKPLKEGDEFPLTLTFEKAGAVEIIVKVEALGSSGMKHGGDMKHGEGMKHGAEGEKKSN